MKKPFLYASAAALYIVIIVSAMNSVIENNIIPQKSIFIPMTMLGLFVLSALIMGFLFLYEPLCLFLEHRKKEAVSLFAKIVGFFACFIVLFLILLFLL